jgi:AAA ATPase domain
LPAASTHCGGSALSPLVGRDEEIELLLRRWARAKAGDGQVVLVSGEPGIGKSRLTAITRWRSRINEVHAGGWTNSAAAQERRQGEPSDKARIAQDPP